MYLLNCFWLVLRQRRKKFEHIVHAQVSSVSPLPQKQQTCLYTQLRQDVDKQFGNISEISHHGSFIDRENFQSTPERSSGYTIKWLALQVRCCD